MTGFEIKLDGVKYFVTAMEYNGGVTSTLYLGSMRSSSIHFQHFPKEKLSKWDIKRVKKFIKSSLEIIYEKKK